MEYIKLPQDHFTVFDIEILLQKIFDAISSNAQDRDNPVEKVIMPGYNLS